MSMILSAAVSGLLAQRYNLDVIANNIANISTNGYKKVRAMFTDAPQETESATVFPDGTPVPEFQHGTGVRLASTQRLFSQGNFKETGNTWDLSIAGEGFFPLALPDGRNAYTRDGAFKIDGAGRLTTADGLLVDPPLAIPAGVQDVQVDETGAVRGTLNGETVEVGSIPIVIFANPEGLETIGHNLYVPSASSGDAQLDLAGANGRGQIVSGVLEESNVDLAEEMTRAMEAQRAYQLSIKALQTADEMIGLANNVRR